MKQYCRYCCNANQCEEDLIYCHIKNDVYSKDKAIKINKCPHFEFNEIDVFDLDKKYTPHQKKLEIDGQQTILK